MAVIASGHSSGSDSGAGAGKGAAALLRTPFVRRVGAGAALLPVSLAAVAAVAVGRPEAARRWWGRLSAQGTANGHRPGAVRLLGHGLLAVPLGLLTLIPIGMELLFVLRGVFYPLVQPGPYTTAWGGPTTGGAWLAHFGVGLLTAAVGLGLLWLLDRLHARLAGGMWGRRVGAWPVVATILSLLGGALLVNAWTHQL
ncbi:hypothetical protein ABT160_27155 [Streptomyces sp. NPDC001941]|uniref:hypothetical protein n=1 Tax=Streptomyces sp. NPDC001941 TaxID=3154659 RepID=UPI00332A4A64